MLRTDTSAINEHSLCDEGCFVSFSGRWLKRTAFQLDKLGFESGLAAREQNAGSSSSVHGILQTRTLEQVTISFPRGSFQPRDQTRVWYIYLH